MHQEVRHVQHGHGAVPGEGHPAQPAGDRGGDVRNEAELLELPREPDEDGEPREGVPRALLIEAVRPRQHPGGEQEAEAKHARHRGGNANGGPTDPRHHQGEHGAHYDLLGGRGWAHRIEGLGSLDGSVRGLLDLRREDLVDDVRHGNEGDDAGHAGGGEPGPPGGHGGADRARQLVAEEVLGGAGHEEGGGDATAVERVDDEEGPHLLLRPFRRVRAARPREGRDDRQHHAAVAGRGGGHTGADDRLGGHECIGKAEGGLPEGLSKHVAAAVPKAGLHKATCDEEDDDDEPDNVIGERAEGRLERERLGEHGGGEAEEGRGAGGQGGQHDAGDRREEDREELPRLHRHPDRARDEEAHGEADRQRDEGGDGLDGLELNLGRGRSGGSLDLD
mmetsp:Transcript_15912/g.50004  ORF Transcript_15912/g.50004 Transcript_15912/m.50004 type:complete len:392 (-) Transcript_15912:206-1381(-)